MPAVVGTLLGWLAGGSALAALVSVVGIISGLVFGLVYRRYLGILGANRRVAAERQTYDALRESLAGSNLATRLYARWLTAFLDRVDRFFGDAGQADQTLFPHAFGLRTPAPLWTAPAFDRCLLLALLYPIASIFIIWAIYGQVGPAEAALRLKAGLSFWQRGNVAIVVGFSFFLPFLFRPPTSPMKPLGWKGLKTRRSIALISLLGIVTVVQVFGRPDLGVFAGASSVSSACQFDWPCRWRQCRCHRFRFPFRFPFRWRPRLRCRSLCPLRCRAVKQRILQIPMARRLLLALSLRDDPRLSSRGALAVASGALGRSWPDAAVPRFAHVAERSV